MWLTQNKFHFKRTFISDEIIASEGESCVTQLRNEFEYMESGIYTLSGIPYFQKRLIVLEGERLLILKENREVLHCFDYPLKFPLVHRHICKDDIYTLTIENDESACLKTVYSVKGPFKDYLIKTVYIKID